MIKISHLAIDAVFGLLIIVLIVL